MDNKIILLGAGALALLLLSKKSTAAAPNGSLMKSTNLSPRPYGQANAPRGIRNNNPLNLKLFPIAWKQKIPKELNTDTNKTFEQFYTAEYGVRAGLKDIYGDITTDGDNTIRKLVYTFAPPYENPTENYITAVSQMSGINPDSILTGTKDQLRRLSQAMANFENYGIKPLDYTISNDLFNKAYSLM